MSCMSLNSLHALPFVCKVDCPVWVWSPCSSFVCEVDFPLWVSFPVCRVDSILQHFVTSFSSLVTNAICCVTSAVVGLCLNISWTSAICFVNFITSCWVSWIYLLDCSQVYINVIITIIIIIIPEAIVSFHKLNDSYNNYTHSIFRYFRWQHNYALANLNIFSDGCCTCNEFNPLLVSNLRLRIWWWFVIRVVMCWTKEEMFKNVISQYLDLT